MKLFKRSHDPRRRKTERYTGWWEAPPTSIGSNVHGKIEWDAFESGDSEIELFVSVPDLPDGGRVIVTWGDTAVMTVPVRRGVAKSDIETKKGEKVPRLADQHVELRHDDVVIARTRLVAD